MSRAKLQAGSRKRAISSAIDQASCWLAGSGIQNSGKDEKLRGGVAAWYELGEDQYPFLYSEITGYALSAFLFLYRIRGEKKMLGYAEEAAEWLIRNALHADGGVKTRLYLVPHYVSPNYSFHQGRVYAFDTGMVGYGLLQLYTATKKDRHLDAIHKIARFLAHRMRRQDGTFCPYYDPSAKKCEEDLKKWSDQRGTFHAKLALFFIDYYRLTRDPAYKKYALSLLDASLEAQAADGRFVTGRKDKSTHLHPHAYTLEGLLYGGVFLGRADYLKAVIRGWEWALAGVSEDGSVSSIYADRSFSHHERSDIVAQVLRIGAALYALSPSKMNPHRGLLKKIKDHLLIFQYEAGTRQKGGFIYGAATDGLIRDHLNAWSTMFALQALWMYAEFVEKKKPLNLENFI